MVVARRIDGQEQSAMGKEALPAAAEAGMNGLHQLQTRVTGKQQLNWLPLPSSLTIFNFAS